MNPILVWQCRDIIVTAGERWVTMRCAALGDTLVRLSGTERLAELAGLLEQLLSDDSLKQVILSEPQVKFTRGDRTYLIVTIDGRHTRLTTPVALDLARWLCHCTRRPTSLVADDDSDHYEPLLGKQKGFIAWNRWQVTFDHQELAELTQILEAAALAAGTRKQFTRVIPGPDGDRLTISCENNGWVDFSLESADAFELTLSPTSLIIMGQRLRELIGRKEPHGTHS